MRNLSMDIEQLRLLLRYDPNTGRLHWRERPLDWFPNGRIGNSWNSRHAGKEAFTSTSADGYRRGTLFGTQWLAHRMAWAILYGEWPNFFIDHINRDPSDNRASNLRRASHSENMKNYSVPRSNTSGIKGVSWHKTNQKWVAQISHNGRKKTLGYFESKADAAASYSKASIEMHGKFGTAIQ